MKVFKIEKIGSGGFGAVWKARSDNGQTIALKELLPGSQSAEEVKRFKQEAKLLQSLCHPNIIKVLAVRTTAPPYWYAMPLCRGSLQGRLAEVRLNSALRDHVFSQVLDAIAHAHHEGVMHRDIKPDNILFVSETEVVVSDFGLGRRADPTASRMTVTGQVLGTPFYASPEQIQDFKTTDHRSDVYSLGMLLYAMSTSSPCGGQIDLGSVPHNFRYPIKKATRQDPDRRYQSVKEFRADFDAAIGLVPVDALQDRLENLAQGYRRHGSLSLEQVDSFVRDLVSVAAEPEVLHQIIMRLPVESLKYIFRAREADLEEVVVSFGSTVKDGVFAFSYCDDVAKRVGDIVEVIRDGELRAYLIAALVDMGSRHNRYFVLQRAAGMIHAARDLGCIDALRDELASLSVLQRRTIREYLSESKLPTPICSVMFPQPDGESEEHG